MKFLLLIIIILNMVLRYNFLHSSSYNFFKENEKTGNLELDKLIFNCVQ